MDYQPGQLVACVDDTFGGGYGTERKPTKGTVYRVRCVVDLSGGSFLRLAEIVNPPKYYTVDGRWMLTECGFDARAFLPLDPKRLDIFRHADVRVPA